MVVGSAPSEWPLSAPLLWPDAAPVNSEMLLKPAFIVNKVISDVKSAATEMYSCFAQEAPLFTADLRSAAGVRACVCARVRACLCACVCAQAGERSQFTDCHG